MLMMIMMVAMMVVMVMMPLPEVLRDHFKPAFAYIS